MKWPDQENFQTTWPCHSCFAPQSVVIIEIAEADFHNQIQRRGAFAALLACNECGARASAFGNFTTFDVNSFNGSRHTATEYKITSTDPAIPLFEPPRETDIHPRISLEVMRSWKLFWADSLGCLNCLRTAAELFTADALRSQGKTWPRNDRGDLSFARVISTAFPTNGNQQLLLHFLRELGNLGSHKYLSDEILHQDFRDDVTLWGLSALEVLLDPNSDLERFVGELEPIYDDLKRRNGIFNFSVPSK